MTAPHHVVFLLDVDNTLLDNDQVVAELRRHQAREFGAVNASRYWEIFEALRSELGDADYRGALQRYRREKVSPPFHNRLGIAIAMRPYKTYRDLLAMVCSKEQLARHAPAA